MHVLNIDIFVAHICPPGTYIKLKLAILLSVVMDIGEKVELLGMSRYIGISQFTKNLYRIAIYEIRIAINHDFYAPGSNDGGHIVFVLSVCLFVCLFDFNLCYNF